MHSHTLSLQPLLSEIHHLIDVRYPQLFSTHIPVSYILSVECQYSLILLELVDGRLEVISLRVQEERVVGLREIGDELILVYQFLFLLVRYHLPHFDQFLFLIVVEVEISIDIYLNSLVDALFQLMSLEILELEEIMLHGVNFLKRFCI